MADPWITSPPHQTERSKYTWRSHVQLTSTGVRGAAASTQDPVCQQNTSLHQWTAETNGAAPLFQGSATWIHTSAPWLISSSVAWADNNRHTDDPAAPTISQLHCHFLFLLTQIHLKKTQTYSDKYHTGVYNMWWWHMLMTGTHQPQLYHVTKAALVLSLCLCLSTAGMQPVLYSVRDALEGRPHWARTGTEVCYFRYEWAHVSDGPAERMWTLWIIESSFW